MSLTEFGPFARVWEQGDVIVSGHMPLLDLCDNDSQVVIDRIALAMAEGDPRRWFAALMGGANWRPHLVGAIAALLDEGRTLDRGLLWSAMDAGSWVTPQLAVTACYTDPDFVAKARDRVGRRCPVRVPTGLTRAERHSATGPIGSQTRSAKMLVSLLAASEEIPGLTPWVASVRNEPDVQELFPPSANDGAERIVTEWKANLRKQFEARGLDLRPAV